MEIGNRIRQYRTARGWNQEDLAEKAFVSRQTISNWENDKSYPDLQSLLLLGSLFGVSLDQLVKGDIEIMQKTIHQQDIYAVNRSAAGMTAFMALAAFSAIPLAEWLGWRALVPFSLLFGAAFFFALRIERSKSSMMSKPTGRLPPFWRARLSMRFSSCEKAASAPIRMSSKCWPGPPSGCCLLRLARCSVICCPK